ncbi:MAG: 3-isopropylmalate dehydratase large subunit [Deltaproteobacteria bacterium RBG_16_48_10]|nr:MAG: 3-isopropylmalate dehydratase large subunit [Deltaproteobacteria bacterium RBG_16_48_10]
MAMTLSEKILASHAGKKSVTPGEFLQVKVDVILVQDLTAGLTIESFYQIGATKVFDTSKIVMVIDHGVPAKTVQTAEGTRRMRCFARTFGIPYYEVGRAGICHIFLPEQGFVLPGDLVVGADSHTCTYGAVGAFATGMGSTDIAVAMATGETWMRVPSSTKFVYRGRPGKWIGGKDLILYTVGQIGVDGANYAAMEFTGEALQYLSMDDRFAMSNMAIEAGAKVGLHRIDEKASAYVKGRAKRPYRVYEPDEDAEYEKLYNFEVSDLEPQVAFPFLPSNVRPISQVGEITIQQAAIGSCCNGWIGDLRIAARILKGRKVHPDVRLIINPGTPQIYLDALREGMIETFVEAGAVISTPNCGPCSGAHVWLLAPGERCIATTNRNFVNRMGGPGSEVYLSGPAVAAASAITGKISSPLEVQE